jgi:hypothetical protein
MSDTTPFVTATSAAHNNPRLAREWITGAWGLFRRDPWLWIGIALFYFLAAILLKRIPFMGNLVLVLLTPIPLAAALLLARDLAASPAAPAPVIPAGWPARRDFFLRRPLGALGRPLALEEYAFPLAMLCIVMLGLTMIAVIFEYLVAGGSVISGVGGARYSGGGLRVTTVLGGMLALVMYGALLMALFHCVPLTLFHKQPVIPALADSFLAWRRAPKPLLVFAGLFALVYALIATAFVSSSTHWIGYLLVFSVGVVALPLFIIGNYLSYRALHGEPSAHNTRS